jgi:hypothetical protein
MRQFSTKQNQPAKAKPTSSKSVGPKPTSASRHDPSRTAALPSGFDFSRIAVHGGTPVRIQPKLIIGASSDALEQEADRVADQVMRAPHPAAQSPARAGFSERPFAPPAQVQAKSLHTGDIGGLAAPPIVHDVLRSTGQPLDAATRAFMEPRFGHDFSKVRDFSRIRIHAGTDAAESAEAMGALAYTAGRDVVFGAGRYQPATGEGRWLLAHELAHVVQHERSGDEVLQRFVPEDAAEEMVGKTFLLNTDITVSGEALAKDSRVVVTVWSNLQTSVTVKAKVGANQVTFPIGKEFLVPAGDSKSGLPQYHAGVAGVEKKYSQLKKKITDQEKVVSDWKAEETKFSTPKGHAEWQRQMGVKETELKDLKFKLTGEGYASGSVPEQLQTTVNKKKVPITPQSTLLNKALIQETMFNVFDASIKKWVAFYDSSIGAPKKWPALDSGLVKSMLYQESQFGTQGDFLRPPPYASSTRMTRFNIGQAIDSSGPQQILMIKEISPAIATKHKLDQVTADRFTAQARRQELLKKGTKIDAAEQLELETLNSRSNDGDRWNDFFTTDPRWMAAVDEFFNETTLARNLDYDFWIRTALRWLYEKRAGATDWNAAIKAYNGSGPRADTYKKDVVGRRDAARAAVDFVPKQHY